MSPALDRSSFVVVANRLPVEGIAAPGGSLSWQVSPGGLVAALGPVMERNRGTWVGWTGTPDESVESFEAEGMRLVPMTLTAEEVSDYYEGFSNATLWPLYHDLAAAPQFHRPWWEAYRVVNQHFAEVAAARARRDALVWVQDYQLQLVPGLLRAMRPDLRIGFFNHIPFPGYEIYSRLPWRRQVVEGLLGADLVGFQRGDDAANFLRACRRLTGVTTHGSVIEAPTPASLPRSSRRLRAASFPISIDTARWEALARRDDVLDRARQLRRELGDPDVVLLGIDRLDYTKGIVQRLRAYGELLDEGELDPGKAILVQVASPSRERVEEYQRLRDEVEGLVGRINGDHSSVARTAIRYLHQSFPKEEMAALYLIADVMLVTPLRDGMNLVAKEYVACHFDLKGTLVLSEFTGAAEELRQAFVCNPYDIEGVKSTILRAVRGSSAEAARRMRSLRRLIIDHDVHHWANTFLGALEMVTSDGSRLQDA